VALTTIERNQIRAAYRTGRLTTWAVNKEGQRELQPIQAVHQHNLQSDDLYAVTTTRGTSYMTGGHRVFRTPTLKVEACSLTQNFTVLGETIVTSRLVGKARTVYDLTVGVWHNFRLCRSGLVVSNSPDQNYRFVPPSREATISQFNRVFGFLWEDYEMDEYIQRSLDLIIASPPRTPFASVEQMIVQKREWTTLLLTGAATFAIRAMMLNWIANEFDFSVGGISLNIEKSSKYESAKGNFEEEFTRQLEQSKKTVLIIRGLQQPRFGIGVRSSFGSFVGRNVVTPRKFIGFLALVLGLLHLHYSGATVLVCQ